MVTWANVSVLQKIRVTRGIKGQVRFALQPDPAIISSPISDIMSDSRSHSHIQNRSDSILQMLWAQKSVPLFHDVGSKLNTNKGLQYFFVNHTNHSS